MAVEVPLVLEIEKYECLYNFNLPEYNRKDTLDYTWAKVAAAVNLSVNECKDKWKNIRSSFVRSVKGTKTSKPYYLSQYLQFIVPYIKPKGFDEHLIVSDHNNSYGGGGGSDGNESDGVARIKEEPTEMEIAFHEVPPFTTIIEEEKPDNTQTIHDPVEDTVKIKRKRRRRFIPIDNEAPRQINKRFCPKPGIKSDNTAMKYFLLSLLPEIDTMDEEQSRLFKIKVMMLIDEIKDKTKKNQKLAPPLEAERVQKRLINLLIKNLKSK